MSWQGWPDDWALVTGASSGIGREFARQLAERGMHLVLVARRRERLEELAAELRASHGVQTLVACVDLSQPVGAADELQSRLRTEGISIRLLCNSAAQGQWSRFEDAAAPAYADMIAVNVTALAVLCQRFLPDLLKFCTSSIINVASPAAYQPVPFMTVYAATKAFVHSFSLALHEEWRGRGVHVQTLIPGPTQTEMAGADALAINGYQQLLTPPAMVVTAALAHLERPVVTTARRLWLQKWYAALLPAPFLARFAARLFRPPNAGADTALDTALGCCSQGSRT
ncbi:MAG: SDR family NAD(P)-dependent oxidoreductase [Gemmataceae bacterium]